MHCHGVMCVVVETWVCVVMDTYLVMDKCVCCHRDMTYCVLYGCMCVCCHGYICVVMDTCVCCHIYVCAVMVHLLAGIETSWLCVIRYGYMCVLSWVHMCSYGYICVLSMVHTGMCCYSYKCVLSWVYICIVMDTCVCCQRHVVLDAWIPVLFQITHCILTNRVEYHSIPICKTPRPYNTRDGTLGL